MEDDSGVLLFSTPAFLWDKSNQLSGTLELWDTKVVFRLLDFKDSHLHLCIGLNAIEKIEEFLVFDLARNGLRIQDKNGKSDFFVIQELREFKKRLNQVMKRRDQVEDGVD